MRVLAVMGVILIAFFIIFAFAGSKAAACADEHAEQLWQEWLIKRGKEHAGIPSREDY